MMRGPRARGLCLPACAIAIFMLLGRTVASEQSDAPQDASEKGEARLPAGREALLG